MKENEMTKNHLNFRLEKEEADRIIEQKRLDYEARLKELEVIKGPEPIPEILERVYTKRELRLISKALARWRTHRFTSLKDELLSTAVLLKVLSPPKMKNEK